MRRVAPGPGQHQGGVGDYVDIPLARKVLHDQGGGGAGFYHDAVAVPDHGGGGLGYPGLFDGAFAQAFEDIGVEAGGRAAVGAFKVAEFLEVLEVARMVTAETPSASESRATDSEPSSASESMILRSRSDKTFIHAIFSFRIAFV